MSNEILVHSLVCRPIGDLQTHDKFLDLKGGVWEVKDIFVGSIEPPEKILRIKSVDNLKRDQPDLLLTSSGVVVALNFIGDSKYEGLFTPPLVQESKEDT